jgi:hypothetical protein
MGSARCLNVPKNSFGSRTLGKAGYRDPLIIRLPPNCASGCWGTCRGQHPERGGRKARCFLLSGLSRCAHIIGVSVREICNERRRAMLTATFPGHHERSKTTTALAITR